MGRTVYQRHEKPIDPGALRSPAIGYSSMSANLPLHEMSLEEKLQAMEALWDDLSREPDRIESPSWHQDLLKETESRVESGEATFSDWEKAKVSIRDRLK
jgi:Putative addiction module component